MTVMSPAKARPAAMTKEEFAAILERLDLDKSAAGRFFSVHRHTIMRWLDGTTPISEPNALLIRNRLPKNKRK